MLRFTPSDARGTSRSIIALVEQDGQARDNIVVARFTGSPPRSGKPTRLRAARRGTRLIVSWGSAAGAERYRATIHLTDGRSLLFATTKARRTFTVSGVASRDRATVRVVGLRGRSRRGPSATLVVAPRRR